MKDNTYQYYTGDMVYKNDKSLNYLLFDEGLVNKSSGRYSYEYHLKDHPGNTRVTCQPNGSTTTTTQVAEYYPFGSSYLPISPARTNKYLYNGKEKQDDILSGTALDWYDYGARFYDPVIGRWHTVDPLCEDGGQESWTPYHYVYNNPVKNTDPDGRIALIDNAIGAFLGVIVDYGEQVATNYIEGNSNPWTNNINLTSIGTSAVVGFVTSGVSAIESVGAKIAVKATAGIINNTVKFTTSDVGLTRTVEGNFTNVVKNTAIDLVANGIAGKAAGKVEGVLSKVGVTNAGRLSSTTRSVVNAVGQNVTRSTTATVKAGLKTASKVVAKTVESTAKATTNSQQDKLKDKTNQ